MADYIVNGDDLSSVADAIRSKGGTTAPMEFPDGFARAVSEISTTTVDTTLTKPGQAADALAVGERFKKVERILPAVTVEDAGKALVVSADGRIVADDGMIQQDVLEEQVLTFATPDPEHPENPYFLGSKSPLWTLAVGETYYVVWDGTVYPCVAANLDAGPEKIIYIGNLGVAEAGENTGEPFLLGDIYTVVDDSGGAVLSVSGGYTNSPDLTLTEVSHTVRIYQRVKAVPYYTKAEIDAALGSYINDIDALIGDISAVTGEA